MSLLRPHIFGNGEESFKRKRKNPGSRLGYIFHANKCMTFWVILLINKQTNLTNHNPLGGGKKTNKLLVAAEIDFTIKIISKKTLAWPLFSRPLLPEIPQSPLCCCRWEVCKQLRGVTCFVRLFTHYNEPSHSCKHQRPLRSSVGAVSLLLLLLLLLWAHTVPF